MLTRIKRFTFSVLLCLVGYTTSAYSLVDTQIIEKNTAHELKCQEAFTKLRDMFQNPLLDEDFNTLKRVTGSKVYLDFLKHAYPTKKPFETLNGLIAAQMTEPPVERYKSFLNEHFKNLTDADFQSIHMLMLLYRHTDIVIHLAEQAKDQQALRTAFKQRVLFLRQAPGVKEWWHSRFSEEKRAKKMAFILALDKFATETQKEDTDWIQAQIKAHGQENAMLWLAIRKPTLIGEIFVNFNSQNAFLAWIEQTAILQRLSALQE